MSGFLVNLAKGSHLWERDWIIWYLIFVSVYSTAVQSGCDCLDSFSVAVNCATFLPSSQGKEQCCQENILDSTLAFPVPGTGFPFPSHWHDSFGAKLNDVTKWFATRSQAHAFTPPPPSERKETDAKGLLTSFDATYVIRRCPQQMYR